MAFGKPTAPKFSIVYPIIIDDDKFVFVMQLALAKLNPEAEDFPYAGEIMNTAEFDTALLPVEKKKKEKLQPETLEVSALVSA